jgi:chromosomal replication initiation ATPase DnaA
MAKLDPHLTFENFVVGPANRLASAAARRAAERPGVSYNPLFIYAGTGMGKTHILSAISRHVAKVSPGKEVEYQTAQEFLREFVQASGGKDEGKVRERYESLDILLLDDVQFLTAQADVQELLLLTLDTLTGEGKQVVLASDRAPAEIDGLGAHLRTRFEGGLLVNIGPPEYETRVAIIKKWVEARLQILAPGVADAMGRFSFQTVTEILTALDRVLEVQGLEDRPLSPEEAVEIIERMADDDGEGADSELGQFLDELSDTVAAKVQAQEAPWRRKLRELAEGIEAEGFKAFGVRRLIDEAGRPRDLDAYLDRFQKTVLRLKEIREELDAAGNPWPEAAHGVLRDPERLDEAEALLSSAKERARPFPEIPYGPDLEDLGGELPQLVLRAADQLATTDRPEYNPLYVWSPGGSAARLLLQAAARTKQAEEGEARVALISVPRFADEFIQALSQGVAGAWRERWWSADFLFVDGAQDLSVTERAQEEFFHLFEALLRRKARIMVSGDQPPTTIPDLDDRLRGRLEGGLVVEVEVAESDLSPDLQEVLKRTAPEKPPPKPQKTDISDADREWIRSFQPGKSGTGRPSGETGEGDFSEFLDVVSVGTPGLGSSDPWVPSPEQVVWVWPRLEDRLVEELD